MLANVKRLPLPATRGAIGVHGKSMTAVLRPLPILRERFL